MALWSDPSNDLAYICNAQITVYKSLFHVQGPGLARKFYLKQKNVENAKKCDFSQYRGLKTDERLGKTLQLASNMRGN